VEAKRRPGGRTASPPVGRRSPVTRYLTKTSALHRSVNPPMACNSPGRALQDTSVGARFHAHGQQRRRSS
jgi:hypothetical protein